MSKDPKSSTPPTPGTAKPTGADYPVEEADRLSQQQRLKKAAAAGAHALKSPLTSGLLRAPSPSSAMPDKPLETPPPSSQSASLIETVPQPDHVVPLGIPSDQEAVMAQTADTALILVELRKISAWANMQRRVTKWSLIAIGVFIPALIVFGILMERQMKTTIEDATTVQKPDWYEVERNVRIGDFDKAIAIGEELILKTPQYPEAHHRLAGAYLAAGKLEKAREHYAEAFRLFPSEENEKLLQAIDKRSSTENP